jgi:hypothetical protein
MDSGVLNVIDRVVKKGAYLYGVCKDHPRASRFGYVLLHRLVAENSIGRRLLETEVVHHIDGNPKNNSPSNLLVTTMSEHSRHHGLERRRAHLTHGTLSSYRYCRCDECKAAKRAHNKKQSMLRR